MLGINDYLPEIWWLITSKPYCVPQFLTMLITQKLDVFTCFTQQWIRYLLKTLIYKENKISDVSTIDIFCLTKRYNYIEYRNDNIQNDMISGCFEYICHTVPTHFGNIWILQQESFRLNQ